MSRWKSNHEAGDDRLWATSRCPPIHLLLFVPNHHDKLEEAAAVFLGLNLREITRCWADLANRKRLPFDAQPPACRSAKLRVNLAGRALPATRWQVPEIISRGYVLATFYYGDITPDKPGNDEGVFPISASRAKPHNSRPTGSAIAAWAWGAQRAVDYLLTDPEVDGHRIVVFGHSRLGKTALLAGAFDDRIAATIAHQAGCGGSAPDRRHNPKSEPAARMDKGISHWLDAVFKEFDVSTQTNHVRPALPYVPLCPAAGAVHVRPSRSMGRSGGRTRSASARRRPGSPPLRPRRHPRRHPARERQDSRQLALLLHPANRRTRLIKPYWDAFLDFADRAVPAKK